MSRRIQIHRLISRPYTHSPEYLRTYLELVVYGPAGKAALQHDLEMLIMAIADLINGGSHTARCQWVINDAKPDETPTAMTVIHGWDKNPGSYSRELEEKQPAPVREILFDAGEVTSRGETVWKAKSKGTRTRSPLADQILYPAEMLRAAIELIMYPPPAYLPPPASEDFFAGMEELAEPPPPTATRWIYRHEGD
jgi:hypothetical protein